MSTTQITANIFHKLTPIPIPTEKYVIDSTFQQVLDRFQDLNYNHRATESIVRA